jgi:hypothetical protein
VVQGRETLYSLVRRPRAAGSGGTPTKESDGRPADRRARNTTPTEAASCPRGRHLGGDPHLGAGLHPDRAFRDPGRRLLHQPHLDGCVLRPRDRVHPVSLAPGRSAPPRWPGAPPPVHLVRSWGCRLRGDARGPLLAPVRRPSQGRAAPAAVPRGRGCFRARRVALRGAGPGPGPRDGPPSASCRLWLGHRRQPRRDAPLLPVGLRARAAVDLATARRDRGRVRLRTAAPGEGCCRCSPAAAFCCCRTLPSTPSGAPTTTCKRG